MTTPSDLDGLVERLEALLGKARGPLCPDLAGQIWRRGLGALANDGQLPYAEVMADIADGNATEYGSSLAHILNALPLLLAALRNKGSGDG